MLMQQRTAQLTIVLKIDGDKRVVQAGATIAIDVLHLSSMARVMEKESASWLGNQPVHCSEDVVAGGVVRAVGANHGVVGEYDSVAVAVVVASVAEELGDIVYVCVACGCVNGGS